MSQLTSDSVSSFPRVWKDDRLRDDNITLADGAASSLSGLLLVIGGVGLLVTIIGAFGSLHHALAAYHVGVVTAMAMTLGALFFVQIFRLTDAGWASTIRRQFENLLRMFPVVIAMVFVMVLIELFSGGVLFRWMDPAVTAGDPLYEHKAAYLNPTFLVIRLMLYASVWLYLSRKLWNYSVEQDRTGDKWLSNKARFTSAWGILATAVTSTFFAFDFLMTLDYHYFSTMWGVYYFAGSAYASIAVVCLILTLLRRAGKLEGLVTDEHRHDLGKLLLAFTVFWSYIAFSQYFLTWYANIPEETAFFLERQSGGLRGLSIFLAVGHFLVPFFILLWRNSKRNPALLAALAGWALIMTLTDMIWIVRPMVSVAAGTPEGPGLAAAWLDAAGIVGVLGIYFGILARRVASGPLVAFNDPRMSETLSHKNYV